MAWRIAWPVGLASILLWFGLAGSAAVAQQIVSSPGPDKVSVTIYRDPNRSAGQPIVLGWLNGYALISETRHIRLPAGESLVRFVGVAGGILPQSAIVTGLPQGVVEKNLDAYLLSPGSLLDRSLGRRVHLRRTSQKTGITVDQEAIVRSGAAGAVVLQTREGFESLRCTGLKESIVYDSLPQGLSAKPTLSVRARAAEAAEAEITLSYLSADFDWQANYVATMAPAGDRLDLFAWVTLANSDETSFVQADTRTVAGHPNRTEQSIPYRGQQQPLYLRCWPAGTTSDLVNSLSTSQSIVVTGSRIMQADKVGAPPAPPPPPPPPAPAAMEARQEELGDLKLYRIPEPVTVAANSQKQVAMLHRQDARMSLVYRSEVYAGASEDALRPARVLRMENRIQDGLGVPLPAGKLMLFLNSQERPILIGQGSIADKAVGEEVEVTLAPAPGISARLVKTGVSGRGASYTLTVTSDRDRPILYEARFAEKIRGSGLRMKDGRQIWSATLAGGGRAVFRFRIPAPGA